MQVVLVMFKADGERRSFSLPKQLTLIGRREDCDLRIPLGDVSRKHCRLIKDGNSLRLEDLGSSNGTFHNGVRVQEAMLEGGDTVQIGPVIFTVQIDGAPADDAIEPPASTRSSGDTDVPSPITPPHSTDSAVAAIVDEDVVDFDPNAILAEGDQQAAGDEDVIDLDAPPHEKA